MGRYAPARSTPTSRFYALVYLDFLQCTRTSHKLPVLFAVLSVPKCLLAINYIRVHYMTLASLFLQTMWRSLVCSRGCGTSHQRYINVEFRLCMCSGTAPLRVCSVVHQNQPATFQSESQQCLIKREKQRDKIDSNVIVGTRTGTDSDDDTALWPSTSLCILKYRGRKLKVGLVRENQHYLLVSFIYCKNVENWLLLVDLPILATWFTCQQVNTGSTSTYFFPLKALIIALL